MKAFVVNRIGDFGFLLAMFLLIIPLRHAQLQRGRQPDRAASLTGTAGVLTAITLLLVLGAHRQSRRRFRSTSGCPTPMEGPTPVSALIHAATMVTAGVYMVVRHARHSLTARRSLSSVVAIIGAATAFFAATGRHRADRHQAGAGLLHHLAARLHVPGLRRLRRTPPPSSIWSRTPSSKRCSSLPPAPSSMPSAANRNMARHGRPAQVHPSHLLDHDHGRLRHLWLPALRRLLFQGTRFSPEVFRSPNGGPLCCGP